MFAKVETQFRDAGPISNKRSRKTRNFFDHIMHQKYTLSERFPDRLPKDMSEFQSNMVAVS